MNDDPNVKAERADEFRFEVTFTTGRIPEVITATRAEEIDGWTYFYVVSGGWALKVQSSVIHHITRGTPTTGTGARASG